MSSRARRFFGCVLPVAFALAACGAVLMVGYAAQVVVTIGPIPDGAMLPIMRANATVLTNNTAFWFEDPYRPSIVTVRTPDGQRAFRRLVGLPDETLVMHNNELTANGKLVLRIAASRPYPDFGPVTVGPDEYFVLAEAPDFPDSRTWGPVAREDVFGVASLYRTARSGGWQPVFTPAPSTRRRPRGPGTPTPQG